MTQTTHLLTSAQVASLLGKSVRTVNRMAKSGDLPIAMKVSAATGAYLFRPEDVEALRTT